MICTPFLHQYTLFQITLTHEQRDVQGLDISTGSLDSLVVVSFIWYDQLLTCGLIGYGGLSKITIPSGFTWTPDIGIVTSPRANSNLGTAKWLQHSVVVTRFMVAYITVTCGSHARLIRTINMSAILKTFATSMKETEKLLNLT